MTDLSRREKAELLALRPSWLALQWRGDHLSWPAMAEAVAIWGAPTSLTLSTSGVSSAAARLQASRSSRLASVRQCFKGAQFISSAGPCEGRFRPQSMAGPIASGRLASLNKCNVEVWTRKSLSCIEMCFVECLRNNFPQFQGARMISNFLQPRRS